MKRIPLAVTCLVLLLFGPAKSEEAYNTDPSTWKLITPPSKEDEDQYYAFLHRANYSDHTWVVDTVNGKVTARLQQDVPAPVTPAPKFDTTVEIQSSKAEAFKWLKVSDGWIVAYNRGEFGAAIYWFSHDGKAKKKISNHQVNQFLLEGERIFAVEGLAHLGMSRGSMIEIKKVDGKWKSGEFLPLPGSAEAIAPIAKGDYVIVTSDSLLRVTLDPEILIIVPNGDWSGFYPTSVAVDGEYIYIGMRQFVARCKVGRSVQKVELLVPSLKWLNTKTK